MSNRIKKIRIGLGLTQQNIADILSDYLGEEVIQQTVQRLETGHTQLTTGWMEKLALALEKKGHKGILPWHFMVDPLTVYPPSHRNIVSAYLALDPDDKRIVDKFLEKTSARSTEETRLLGYLIDLTENPDGEEIIPAYVVQTIKKQENKENNE